MLTMECSQLHDMSSVCVLRIFSCHETVTSESLLPPVDLPMTTIFSISLCSLFNEQQKPVPVAEQIPQQEKQKYDEEFERQMKEYEQGES